MIDLKSVINQYPEYVQDGKKLKSLLSDLYPSESLYASILCSMLDDGIIDEIKGREIIDKLTFTNLSSQIEAKHGYAQKYIDGCLSILANAFGIKIVVGQELPTIVPIKKPNKKEKEIDATIHTHKYKTIKIAPTCTEQGYTLYRCDCGYEYKNNFVQPKHDYVLVEYIEPTCETDGRERYKCANCGEEKVVVLQAAGHKFGQWIEQEKPTCEKDGFALRQCKRCGKKEKQLIKATGHNFAKWRQEGDEFVRNCDRCGKTEKMPQSEFYFSEAEKYRTGEKVKKDLQKAYEFYLKAANSGNAKAMTWLGLFEAQGLNGNKNIDESIKWFRRATEANDNSEYCSIAFCMLGVCYMDGVGVTADESSAEQCFQKAIDIDKNNIQAKENLKLLHERQQKRERTEGSNIWVGVGIVVAIAIWIGLAVGLTYAAAGEFSIGMFIIALIAIPIIILIGVFILKLFK